ncbi:hypothetical protein CHN50_12690 [Priestia aryabhattai]|nr:hypothetical protein CHN50_12690 [Priestia aryabhattai]
MTVYLRQFASFLSFSLIVTLQSKTSTVQLEISTILSISLEKQKVFFERNDKTRYGRQITNILCKKIKIFAQKQGFTWYHKNIDA